MNSWLRSSRVVMGLLLFPALAHAFPEVERGAWTGGASTTGLAVSLDGRYVATSQRSAEAGLAIWDRLAPDEGPTLAAICEATSIAFTTHATRGDAFYVGCGDETVLRVVLDGDAVPPSARVDATITVGTGVESVVGVAWALDDTHLHVVTSESNLFRLHRVDLASDAVDGSVGLPTSTAGVSVGLAVAAEGTPVLVAQADGGLFWATRSASSYTTQEVTPLSGTVSALAVDPSGVSAVFLLALESRGEVWAFTEASPGSLPTLLADGLTSPQALAFIDDGGSSPVVFVAGSDSIVEVFDLAGTHLDSVALGSASEPLAIVADPSDSETVYVAGGDGSIRVLSARPWVSDIGATPESVGEGETVTVSFTVDVAASWDLRAEAGLSPSAGVSLATGTAAAAGVVEATFSADELPAEGSNRLVVFATADGATGVNSTVVTLDTPPDGVSATTATAGDARAVLSWTSSDETDIASYRVVVSDAAFSAATNPRPTFSTESTDGEPVTYPREVEAGEPNSSHSIEVLGLVNGQSYWFAVLAVDESGSEGPLSAVVSVIPAQTCGLVECVGDSGCSCTAVLASPRPEGSFLGLVGLAVWARRRRP